MLDPLCGFCYRDNGTAVYDSSCVPANRTYTNVASWGRSDLRGFPQNRSCDRAELLTGRCSPRSRCSNQSEAAGAPFWAYNYCPTSYSWLVLLGLLLYLAFFAPGLDLKASVRVCSLRFLLTRVPVRQGWAPCPGP